MTSSQGRVPQGEVIIDFADGGSYIKNKLEDNVVALERRRITQSEAKKASSAMQALDLSKSGVEVKSQDVDFVVAQLGIKRDEAESALKAENGDLVKTLLKLVKPRPRASSFDGTSQ